MRRQFLQACVVALAGLLTMSLGPVSARAAQSGGCTFCLTSCPSQPEVMCSNQGCGGFGAMCGHVGSNPCLGSDGYWYNYRLTCTQPE